MDDMPMTWVLTYARRSYWPERLPDPEPENGTGSTSDWLVKHDRVEHWLETIARMHSRVPADIQADYCTDQYNVYRGRELIAVYMVD